VHLADIFGTTGDVNWAQECARAVLIFGFGLLLIRLAGRRVFGKWSALDTVVAIIAGSNLSRAITGSAPLWGTLAATAILMLLHWILAYAVARSPRLSRVLEGRPVDLAHEGQVRKSALRRHAVSEADLTEALRRAGVEDVEDTGKVVLEPSGKISVLKRG
jgi:uncharacterized membrane protein YcaP (DUF421 family)